MSTNEDAGHPVVQGNNGAQQGVFRDADLRGMNFEGAFLAGGDFSKSRMGMRAGWLVILVAAALLVSVSLGILTGFGTRFLRSLINSGEPRQVSLALNAAAALLVLIVAAIWKGGDFASKVVLPIIAALIAASALIAIGMGVGTGTGALAVLGFILLGVAIIALGALVRAAAGTAATATFAVVAIAGGLAGGAVDGGLAAVVVALTAMLIGRRTLKGSAKYPLLARLCAQIACLRGTRFRNADLSDADFSGADLTASDFRGAYLGGARFDDAAHLRLCLFDDGQSEPPPSQLERRPAVNVDDAS